MATKQDYAILSAVVYGDSTVGTGDWVKQDLSGTGLTKNDNNIFDGGVNLCLQINVP